VEKEENAPSQEKKKKDETTLQVNRELPSQSWKERRIDLNCPTMNLTKDWTYSRYLLVQYFHVIIRNLTIDKKTKITQKLSSSHLL